MGYDKVVDSAVLDGYFEDIADALRDRSETTGTYTPGQIPQAITDIPHDDTFADMYLKQSGRPTHYENLTATNVSGGAFCYSPIQTVNLPEVTYVGDYAFLYATELTSITLNKADIRKEESFRYCTKLTSAEMLIATTIGTRCFGNCTKLKTVNTPNVTVIKSFAFEDSLSSSETVELSFPALTDIKGNAFSRANINKISCPNLESLGGGAFVNSTLGEFTVPSTCTTVETSVFQNCRSLIKVVFENDLSAITSSLFYNCTSLSEVDLSRCTAVPTLPSTQCFYNVPSNCVIKVPSSLEAEWKAATNWTVYANQIQGV